VGVTEKARGCTRTKRKRGNARNGGEEGAVFKNVVRNQIQITKKILSVCGGALAKTSALSKLTWQEEKKKGAAKVNPQSPPKEKKLDVTKRLGETPHHRLRRPGVWDHNKQKTIPQLKNDKRKTSKRASKKSSCLRR